MTGLDATGANSTRRQPAMAMAMITGFVKRQRRTAKAHALPARGWVFGVVVTVIFGIAIPAWLLLQAHSALTQLSSTLKQSDGYPLLEELTKIRPTLQKTDDYRIASQVIAESASQRTMLNKQLMKASAMQVGFATMSLGLMLILLGVKEEQRAAFAFSGFSVDLGRVTTGALVFLAGSAITAAAALLANSYRTVSSPSFGNDTQVPACAAVESDAITGEAACRHAYAASPDKVQECLKELGKNGEN